MAAIPLVALRILAWLLLGFGIALAGGLAGVILRFADDKRGGSRTAA